MLAPSDGPSGLPSRRFLPFLILAVVLLGAANPARAEFRIQSPPIAACAGSYTDTGGPSGNYGNGEVIEQTIWPAQPNTRVALGFIFFQSEAGFDYLRFYNGHSTSAPYLGLLNGGMPAQTIASTAADGSLTLQWSSDGSTTASGWEAGIFCLPAEQRERTEFAYTCDGEFTDSGGPGAAYQNLETYLLVVNPTHGYDQLEVTFSAFDTELGYDALDVYDGIASSDPLLGTFSGTALPPTLRSTNPAGALTFRFISDGSNVGNGWRAAFNCAHRIEGLVAPAVKSCSGTIVDSGGSGGYYSSGEYFLQTLLPEDPDAKLELAFTSFLTEAGGDLLTIYDGNSTAAPSLGTFSGSSSPGLVTSSAVDGALTLTWISNGSSIWPGWIANLSCVYPVANGLVSTCSAISTDTGGRGETYDYNESLVQTFERSRPWSQMRATVYNFASEDGYDFLKIRDGAAGAPILGTLTGSPALPVGWVAPNLPGQLTLDWISDFSTIGAGWNALVRCELPVFADGFEGRDLAQWSVAAP